MRIALLLVLVVASASPSHGQGFGKVKKTVTLERRLPAAVHLTGTAIQVKAVAGDPRNSEVARQLGEMIEAEMLKNDKRLRLEAAKPETVVSCTVTSVSLPPARISIRSVAGQPPERVYHVSGVMALVYQANDVRAGRAIDSDNVTISYEDEFDETGARLANRSFSALVAGITKPFTRGGDKPREPVGTARTQEELRQSLVHRAALQIAARLVETGETVEVLLARGKLDDHNRFADARLWSRMLEPLETMPPFPTREDDAYRLYNIGVVYEALAYQAEDLKAAKKFFDQAAIHYGKAIDAKPDEKYFLEPQTRIQTAISHYKKLEDRAAASPPAPAAPPSGAPPQSAPAPSANVPTPSPPTVPPGQRPPAPAPAKTSRPPGPATKPPAGPMTNEQVIRLAASGLDESRLIAAIRSAPAVKFDFEIADVIHLSEHGVKGAVLAAMRERAARPAAANPVRK